MTQDTENVCYKKFPLKFCYFASEYGSYIQYLQRCDQFSYYRRRKYWRAAERLGYEKIENDLWI